MESTDDRLVLDALRAAYPEIVDEPNWLPRVDATDADTVWGRLRLAMEAHQIFGRGRHVFAGAHQLQLHPGLFSQFLSRPLKRRGPVGTLAWLHEIYSLETFASRQCAELLGVKLAREIEFTNGVRLVPFENMRGSYHADGLKYAYAAPQPMVRYEPQQFAGMYKLVTLSFSPDHKHLQPDYSAFNAVTLGITIASDGAPVVGLAWSEFENTDYADAEIGWVSMPPRYDGRPPAYQAVELTDEHVAWVNRYLSLSGQTQKACSVAASRLNSARRRVDPVDCAIDLATAFEALISKKDETSEISYRLRLRAALLLGASYDERVAVSKHFAELYSLRSKGIHGAGPSDDLSSAQKTVTWGQKACQQLLLLVVEAGRLPDLRRLELTGDAGVAFS